jgi:hypothetical protein
MPWATSPPPHDNPAHAPPPSRARGAPPGEDWTATTTPATTEPGQPGHNPASPHPTVWSGWTAPASGPATFSVADTSADNMPTAYTPTAHRSLTQVAPTDHRRWHKMRRDTAASATYLITGHTDGSGGQLRVRRSHHPDQAKPSATSTINGGAASTTNRMVTLTLRTTDNMGGTGVRTPNSASLEDVDGEAGAQQQPTHAADTAGNPVTVPWPLTDLFHGGSPSTGPPRRSRGRRPTPATAARRPTGRARPTSSPATARAPDPRHTPTPSSSTPRHPRHARPPPPPPAARQKTPASRRRRAGQPPTHQRRRRIPARAEPRRRGVSPHQPPRRRPPPPRARPPRDTPTATAPGPATAPASGAAGSTAPH